MRELRSSRRQRLEGWIRVWLARVLVRHASRLGNRIPNGSGRHRLFKREGAAVHDPIAPYAAHERSNHSTAHQQASLPSYEMHVDVPAWKQPHFTLGKEARIRQINDSKLTASTEPHCRHRFVVGRLSTKRTPPLGW